MPNYAIVGQDNIVKNIVCAGEGYARSIGAVPAYLGLKIGDTYAAPDLRTPAQKREDAYNGEAAVKWENKTLTVTEAAQLWQYYAAEGSGKAELLQSVISAAKQAVRERYPDEEARSE